MRSNTLTAFRFYHVGMRIYLLQYFFLKSGRWLGSGHGEGGKVLRFF